MTREKFDELHAQALQKNLRRIRDLLPAGSLPRKHTNQALRLLKVWREGPR